MSTVRKEFEAELRRRNIAFALDKPSGRHRVELTSGSALISLANLEKDVAADGDLSRVTRFVDTVLGSVARSEDALSPDRLLWLLEPNDYVDKPELRVIVSDKVDRVLVQLAADRSEVTWVSQSMIERARLSFDQAGQVASQNLDRELEISKLEFTQIDDVRLGFLAATQPVKASLILAPSFRKKVEEEIGWPVLAVTPDRDFLYFWAASHKSFAGRVGRVVVREFGKASYPISTEVYLIDETGIKAIGEFPQPTSNK